MKILTHPKFDKNFSKRISPHPNLLSRFQERVKLFVVNPYHPLLKNHQLAGTLKSYRSFSITGNIRVVYQLTNPHTAIFINIGTHNQVY